MSIRIASDGDRAAIAAFLRRQPDLFIYELGDLDPFFWPHTRFFLREDEKGIAALVMLYDAADPPTLLALGRDDSGATAGLLRTLSDELPDRMYGHLTPGFESVLAESFIVKPNGEYLKMILSAPERIADVATDGVEKLTETRLADLNALYERAYPNNWFDSHMLSTGQYYGGFADGKLVAVAGIHVYSPQYGVAALGNITTDPAHRGLGFARRCTARLCQELRRECSTIGLNVKHENAAAISCYRGLGFTPVGDYNEAWISRSR